MIGSVAYIVPWSSSRAHMNTFSRDLPSRLPYAIVQLYHGMHTSTRIVTTRTSVGSRENVIIINTAINTRPVDSRLIAVQVHVSRVPVFTIDVFCILYYSIHYRGPSTLSNWIWVLPIVHLILECYFA